MRKALLFASSIVLTAAALAKPVQAAPSTCGCWCCMPAYYSTYTCRLSNGGTATCKTYCNIYC